MSINPVTVTQLSTYIKQIFDAEELIHDISVVGEISGYSNVRGTAYFSLKDENSVLQCVCFTADNFKDVNNGDRVVVVGSPRYYVKGGKLNFNVVSIEHYGESILFQKFLELKAKLEKKGYFEQGHKKEIPNNIKRIGVVSSEGGAVIRDIINVRTRRNPQIDIVLYPVKVQGESAEFEIAKGIQVLDNYNVDVIVVARGGGSMEDLQPFNTKIVADATYSCKKFIMSAVGHETDFTIIDFCSDLRAPTPSAAAELLCENLADKKYKFNNCVCRLINSFSNMYKNIFSNFSNNAKLLEKNYSYVEQDTKNVFNNCLVSISKFGNDYFANREKELINYKNILNKLNPEEVLKLGYAFLKKDKCCVVSAKEVSVGDNLEINLKDGVVSTKVLGVKHELWAKIKRVRNNYSAIRKWRC